MSDMFLTNHRPDPVSADPSKGERNTRTALRRSSFFCGPLHGLKIPPGRTTLGRPHRVAAEPAIHVLPSCIPVHAAAGPSHRVLWPTPRGSRHHTRETISPLPKRVIERSMKTVSGHRRAREFIGSQLARALLATRLWCACAGTVGSMAVRDGCPPSANYRKAISVTWKPPARRRPGLGRGVSLRRLSVPHTTGPMSIFVPRSQRTAPRTCLLRRETRRGALHL